MLTLFSNQILGNVVWQLGVLLWGQRDSIFNIKALLENLRYVILIAIGGPDSIWDNGHNAVGNTH